MPIIVSSTATLTATAEDIVKRAIRLLGEGRTPSDDELSDGREALNAMLDEWRNDGLMCYALRDETFNTQASVATYNIGPSGDLDTVRPLTIEGCYVVISGVSYPVKVLETAQQYASIKVKGQLGDWPLKVYYVPSVPLGELVCYPVPNGTVEMHILTKTPLTYYSLADTPELPPGWIKAMEYNLAIELSSEYETDPRQTVMRGAINSKRGIRKANTVPVVAKPSLAWLKIGRRPNILADGE